MWTRRGHLYAPTGEDPRGLTHASLPVALIRPDGTRRVFFASRDAANRSHVWAADLDGRGGELRVDQATLDVVLEPGPLGHFDGQGVYPASVIETDGRVLLYFIGWTIGSPAPLFYAAVGLAVSHDGGMTFERLSNVPIMGRGQHDPWMVTSPCVRREGARWRMWYVSGLGWEQRAGQLQSLYHVKSAESDDGVKWRRDGQVAIGLQGDETNVARPCVTGSPGAYEMWFSCASGGEYRIGYATSPDGCDWQRRSTGGLAPGDAPWESKAVAYPWVFTDGDRDVLLYNGDGFGRTGFGWAVRAAPR